MKALHHITFDSPLLQEPAWANALLHTMKGSRAALWANFYCVPNPNELKSLGKKKQAGGLEGFGGGERESE